MHNMPAKGTEHHTFILSDTKQHSLTGKLSATGSTGLWKGQAKWCLQSTRMIFFKYWSWFVVLFLFTATGEGVPTVTPGLVVLSPSLEGWTHTHTYSDTQTHAQYPVKNMTCDT